MRVEVRQYYDGDAPRPAIPSMPAVTITPPDPSVISGTDPQGDPLPSSEVGTVTVESSTAGALAGVGYRPLGDGSTQWVAYRNYDHEVVYLGVPGCGVSQEWTADLTSWVVAISDGATWTQDTTFDDMDVEWGCEACAPSTPTTKGPADGKNARPEINGGSDA